MSTYHTFDVYEYKDKSLLLSFVDFYNEGYYKLSRSSRFEIYKPKSNFTSDSIKKTAFNNSPWRITANVICTAIFPVLILTLACKYFSKENQNQRDRSLWLGSPVHESSLINSLRSPTPSLRDRAGNLANQASRNFINNTNWILSTAEKVAAYLGVGDGSNSVKRYIANKLSKFMIIAIGSSFMNMTGVQEALTIQQMSES